MRIPFDSLTLAAVVAELQPLVGARLEKIVQTDGLTVVLGFYKATESFLLLSADPNYARAHLIARRPEGVKPPPRFCADLRRLLADATLQFVRQRGLDRVMEIGLSAPYGDFQLVAELMGKHSNLILVRQNRSIATAIKYIGPTKSQRPVLAGKPYEPPPFEPRPSLLEARPGDNLREFDAGSPFLAKLIEAGTPLEEVQSAVREGRLAAFYAHGHGAYPLPLGPLGLPFVVRASIGLALEQAFTSLIESDRAHAQKQGLLKQLARVLLAREVALKEVRESVDAARNADRLQLLGQLVLAYQAQIKAGDRVLDAWDYEGRPLAVPLRADLTPLENAQRYFDKAKRAKARADEMLSQEARLDSDAKELARLLQEVEETDDPNRIKAAYEEAERRRWLNLAPLPARSRDERPFEGHAIRELVSPGGWRVLYGENATSNDYLTTKLARPSDLWFHVRGAPSAHVVLATNNQPDRVQRADLEFAARVAVSRSPSKHSGYVSVDYVQKRHVRKPRGSAPGFATYTNEKTLHVET